MFFFSVIGVIQMRYDDDDDDDGRCPLQESKGVITFGRVITSENFEDFKCSWVHFSAQVSPKCNFNVLENDRSRPSYAMLNADFIFLL